MVEPDDRMHERKILILGGGGQVGWELRRTLLPLGSITASDRNSIDLSSLTDVRGSLRALRPDVIVNAAAYTAVDRAESEAETARAINTDAPALLAEEARRLGALLVHFSTDYIYDGAKEAPYAETDAANPLGVYGRTKLEGDQAIEQSGCAHLILRTSWVYGARGKNFLLTMLRLFREREEVRVVDDQVGCPTWSRWIAGMTAHAVHHIMQGPWKEEQPGLVYNLSGGGGTTWFGFAQAILEEARRRTREPMRVQRIIPITSDEYPAQALRPRHSRLSTERISREMGLAITPWETQLACCLDDMLAEVDTRLATAS